MPSQGSLTGRFTRVLARKARHCNRRLQGANVAEDLRRLLALLTLAQCRKRGGVELRVPPLALPGTGGPLALLATRSPRTTQPLAQCNQRARSSCRCSPGSIVGLGLRPWVEGWEKGDRGDPSLADSLVWSLNRMPTAICMHALMLYGKHARHAHTTGHVRMFFGKHAHVPCRTHGQRGAVGVNVAR